MPEISSKPPVSREELQGDGWLRNVCALGHGPKCCRYLICDPDGFNCAKNTSVAATIQGRIAEGTFNAKGDNCPGLGAEQTDVVH